MFKHEFDLRVERRRSYLRRSGIDSYSMLLKRVDFLLQKRTKNGASGVHGLPVVRKITRLFREFSRSLLDGEEGWEHYSERFSLLEPPPKDTSLVPFLGLLTVVYFATR